MSSDSNREDGQQSADTAKNDKKALTFKDWKMLKESQSKPNEKSQNRNNFKTKSDNKNNGNARMVNRNNYNNNGFNEARGFNCQGAQNFFDGNYIMPTNNFNGMNNFNNSNGMHNFNNNFGMRSNTNFGHSNKGFNKSNVFGFNTFNIPNNISNNFSGNNFNNGFNNYSGPNNFGNGRNRLNGPNNGYNLDLPGNFFASDGIYRQKDLMQKPMPDNPFRNDKKADHLLQEFDKSRYTKDDKKKKKGNKNPSESKKSTSPSKNKPRGLGDTLHNNEPKIFIPNPKAKVDGKPFIPKPKLPEENLDISKEEKKQQWKEYRDAMKPFKNREFYNAKRVVQRLGKLDPSVLEEKQIIRLANAREIMVTHKARLTEKYANYVKADDDSNDLGELYVLKGKFPKDREFGNQPMNKTLQNYGNFGETNDDYESGRKILGGFIPGGMLDSSDHRFSPH